MSERNESQPKRFSRGRIAAGLACIAAGVAVTVRPDLYTYFLNQADTALHPEPTPTAASPLRQPTPSALIPPKASVTPSSLGEGRGEAPVSFSWKTSNFNLHSSDIQRKDEITDEPNGSHAVAWTELEAGFAGACAEEGNVFIGAHSSPEFREDAALVPRDFARRAGKTGVGSVIELKTEDGTSCQYEMELGVSVKKRGSGEGTFTDFVKNNPTGRDLRDPNVEPGIVFTTCDELKGWDFEHSTSLYNYVWYGRLVKVVPPKEK